MRTSYEDRRLDLEAELARLNDDLAALEEDKERRLMDLNAKLSREKAKLND